MGDLLPPTIYIPYLKMLQGLANGPQCAHYCFSLLKVNGSSHVENIQGAGGSPVSWEHFFHSLLLYHEHLRKDLPSADSVQYRHLPSRGITQKEQDGLIAFLQLTSTIITWVGSPSTEGGGLCCSTVTSQMAKHFLFVINVYE